MKHYQLNADKSFAQEFVDQIPTGNWVNTQSNQAYLAWLDEGNTPLPAPAPEPAPVLTTEQKLEAAGLTVAELRTLFGLPAPEA